MTTVPRLRGVAALTPAHRALALFGVIAGLSCASETNRTVAAVERIASRLAVVTQPAGAVPGAMLNTQPVVQVRDADDEPVTTSTAPVTAVLATGIGTLSGTTTINAVNGVATFTDLRVDVEGNYTLGFGSPGLTDATSAAFAITVPPPAALGIQRQPQGTASGTPLATQPIVRVLDANGFLIPNSSLTITASIASGTGALSGATSVDAVNGVATFTNLTITGSGAHALQFSATGVSPTTSQTLTLVAPAPPPTLLALATQPAGAVSNAMFATQPIVQVRDAANNLASASSALITAAVGSGAGTLTGTTTRTALNGVATFTDLGISGTGPHALVFTSSGLAPATTASFTVADQAGPPTQLAVSVQPGGASSGAVFGQQPVVQVRDAAGNIAPSSTAPVTVVVFSGGGTLTGTTSVVPINGIVTYSDLAITGSGSQLLRFSSVGLSAVNSAAFVVSSAATQLALSRQPAGAVSGAAFTTQPVVELRDANNALASTSNAAVTVVLASGSGALIGTTTVNAVNGVATFTNLGISGTGTHTLSFSGAGLTSVTSAPLSVQAASGTAIKLGVSTQPSGATSGQPFSVQPIVQVRDAGNGVVVGSSAAVTASLASGSGALSGATTVTAASGVATFTDLTITGTGAHALTFSSTGLAAAQSASFSVVGVPNALSVASQPAASAVSGSVMTPQPAVQLRDASNNPVAQAGTVITVSLASGSGTLSGTATATTNASGVANFTDLRITGSGTHTLAFAASGLTSVISGPINITATVAPLMTISFDNYTSTAALIADCVTWFCVEDNLGTPGVSVVLDDTTAPPGATKSMRYHYNHGGNGCNSLTRGRAFLFPTAQQEVWAEFKVRWSSNFTTSNSTCPPNDHKLIFGDTEASQSGRWAFYVGADSPPLHSLQVERPTATGGSGGYYLNRNSPSIVAENLWNGAWHTVRLHIKHSTTATSGDGTLEVWINGVLKHQESGFSTARPAGEGGGADRLSGFSFTHNKDDGPPNVDMFLWWGPITVYSVNPGW